MTTHGWSDDIKTLNDLVSLGAGKGSILYDILSRVEKYSQTPLMCRATLPVSNLLVFLPNKIGLGDGSYQTTSPVGTMNDYPETTINFATGAVVGGDVVVEGGNFAFPTASTGEYAWMAVKYDNDNNQLDIGFSEPNSDEGLLENAGQIFRYLAGEPIALLKIQKDASGWHTKGAADTIVENEGISRFGAGANSGEGVNTFPYAQRFVGRIETAEVAVFDHHLDGIPHFVEVWLYDSATGKLTPLTASSYVTSITNTQVEVSTEQITFAAGDYVEVKVGFISQLPNGSVDSSVNFKSEWFVDKNTTQVAHGLLSANDIVGLTVQEWNTVTGRRRNLWSGPLNMATWNDTNLYWTWDGLTPSSTLKYRICTGVTAIPVARPTGQVRRVSGNYTVIETDKYIMGDDDGANFTHTLPLAVTFEGWEYTIKNVSSAYNLTVSAASIDGLSTKILVPNASLTVVSDGTIWRIL